MKKNTEHDINNTNLPLGLPIEILNFILTSFSQKEVLSIMENLFFTNKALKGAIQTLAPAWMLSFLQKTGEDLYRAFPFELHLKNLTNLENGSLHPLIELIKRFLTSFLWKEKKQDGLGILFSKTEKIKNHFDQFLEALTKIGESDPTPAFATQRYAEHYLNDPFSLFYVQNQPFLDDPSSLKKLINDTKEKFLKVGKNYETGWGILFHILLNNDKNHRLKVALQSENEQIEPQLEEHQNLHRLISQNKFAFAVAGIVCVALLILSFSILYETQALGPIGLAWGVVAFAAVIGLSILFCYIGLQKNYLQELNQAVVPLEKEKRNIENALATMENLKNFKFFSNHETQIQTISPIITNS